MRQVWTRSPFIPAALVLSAAVAHGCGVSDATLGLFSPGAEVGSGGAATTSSTSSATSGQGGSSTTMTSTSSGASGGGGVGGGVGGGATTTSSGTGGPAQTLDCEGSICPRSENSACCYDSVGDQPAACIEGPPSSATCNTDLTQGGVRSRIECQLPSHCDASQICCGTRQPLGMGRAYYPTVQCQSVCDRPDVQLCDPENPVCPIVEVQGGQVQTECRQSELLPANYFVCALPP